MYTWYILSLFSLWGRVKSKEEKEEKERQRENGGLGHVHTVKHTDSVFSSTLPAKNAFLTTTK